MANVLKTPCSSRLLSHPILPLSYFFSLPKSGAGLAQSELAVPAFQHSSVAEPQHGPPPVIECYRSIPPASPLPEHTLCCLVSHQQYRCAGSSVSPDLSLAAGPGKCHPSCAGRHFVAMLSERTRDFVVESPWRFGLSHFGYPYHREMRQRQSLCFIFSTASSDTLHIFLPGFVREGYGNYLRH